MQAFSADTANDGFVYQLELANTMSTTIDTYAARIAAISDGATVRQQLGQAAHHQLRDGLHVVSIFDRTHGVLLQGTGALRGTAAGARARPGGALVTAVLDHGDLARAVSEHLSPLGIESCYLAILNPPDPSRAGRTARLVLAYEASVRAARPAALSYRAEEILPYAAMTTGRRPPGSSQELGSRGREQALLIVDLGQPEGHAYEALRHIFGAVLAGARLGPMGALPDPPAESLRATRAEDPRLPAGLASARDAVGGGGLPLSRALGGPRPPRRRARSRRGAAGSRTERPGAAAAHLTPAEPERRSARGPGSGGGEAREAREAKAATGWRSAPRGSR